MAKLIHSAVLSSILSSCLLLVESRSIQQVQSPTHTSSLPFTPPLNESTPLSSEKATLNLDSSPSLNPSEEHSVWPTNQTDLTNAISQMDSKKEWFYRAVIMALILFLLLALIGWGRECLRRKKLQVMLPENAELLGEEHPNKGEGKVRNQATSNSILSGGGTDDLVPVLPVLPNDIASDTLLPNNHDGDGTKSCTNHTDNGAVLLGDGIPLPVDEIPHDITVHSMDGDTRDTARDHIRTSPNNSQDESPSKCSRDGINESTSGNIDGAMALGGDQTSTDTSTDGTINTEEVGARGGACGPPSDGVGDDVRRTNPATHKVDPGIKADDVVTTQFLQHVAQEISHGKSKTICRMLGLLERDIDDVEMLTHKTEQGFEFLKRLLGDIGKDLTYRSIVKALIKCKNKNHADNLIEEFNILL